jgi:hypothetical protein
MCLLPLYSSLCVSVVSLSIAVFRLEVPMAFSSDISNYLSTYITVTLFLYLTSYYSYLFHMCFTSLPPTIQGRSAALVSLSSDRCLVACTRLSPSRVCIFRWVRRQAWSLELPSYTVCIHTYMHTHIHTYVCVWTVFVCHRHGVYVLTTSMYVCSDVLVGNFLTVCIYVVWSATFLLFHIYIYAYTHTYTYL